MLDKQKGHTNELLLKFNNTDSYSCPGGVQRQRANKSLTEKIKVIYNFRAMLVKILDCNCFKVVFPHKTHQDLWSLTWILAENKCRCGISLNNVNVRNRADLRNSESYVGFCGR